MHYVIKIIQEKILVILQIKAEVKRLHYKSV